MSENTEITFSRWVDRVADEFEAAWKKGDPPSIQEYLDGYSQNQQHELLRELILIDLAYRHRTGERVDLDDYLKRFPELLKPDSIVDSDLILQARQVTRKEKSEDSLSKKTLKSRFENESIPSSIPMVIDKYQILDLVGEGAFGLVYKAIDTELNRTVAIKVPRSGTFLRPKDKERFQREAQSAAALNHLSIVKVFDVVLDGSLPYIVNDFIQGTTLADFLQSRTISPREAAKMLLKITEAIEHAHQQGLVHRDLKPTNILIDEEGNPHITDFGLAKSESVDFTVTIDGQILGTPAYMSPEQARGESSAVDFRMDVYSLGAIFYELLTGEKPFRGTTQMVLQQVQNEQPRAPRKINERIPRDLETICLKCLEKEARLRFSSATELVEELKRFLRGDTILSRPVGRIESLWRRCKRNPVISGLVVLIALSLIFGTVISSYFAFDARSQKKIAEEERESAKEERNEAEKQKILEQLRNLRLNERNYSGWTDKAKTLLEQARGKLSPSELRDQTVATYIGIEATLERGFGLKGGSSVAFDLSGKRLVIGGLTRSPNERDRFQDESGARVWDIENDSVIETNERSGTGPVAFHKNDPVELIRENETTLVLRTIPKRESIRTFVIPMKKKSIDEHFQWTLSKDTGTIAASALHKDGSRTAWVWNVESGKMLHELKTKAASNPGTFPTPEKPNARVALSSDGSLVAVGTETGQIYVWRVTDGTKIAVLRSSQNTIQSLAFSPKPGRHSKVREKKSNVTDWMLAAGDSGGAVVIRDLEHFNTIQSFHGSLFAIYALAFNSDGTILATAGRAHVRLWNAVSGELLLVLDHTKPFLSTDYVTGLVFSADDRTLVVAGKKGHAIGDEVHAWKLRYDWGIRQLRGLTGPAEKIVFSRDGKKVAIFSHD